ncbi:DUF1572 family protein [Deinococcus maricopensis]|uniref:DinB-like domain-containing protein n=1 Tax=Deinococcus maricopensis (strain DSM 21211 / LMG 22137 / NRRL B-23946 / LB-34) TaxID=709986 RepID=E8UB58_DEIML|nr:DUF1572 family protein [Deinococcus maricopensis]ADV68297.1 protein of unknown function DUF1572 [Deinococcus maricopensis DSM 21211]
MTQLDVGAVFLAETITRMQAVRDLGAGALAQLRAEQWHAALGPDENSAAVIVQHLAGNMQSRWAGFPDADGESAARDRDAEFDDQGLDVSALLARWDAGWAVFLAALERLTPEDLTRTVTIRGEAHTVLAAVQRQVAHYSGHVYQLVFLARHLRGADWRTLSIPRGGSAAFNARMAERHPGR